MAAFEEKLQALMDEFYSEWQKEENKGKDKWEILGNFSEEHQIAVVFGNFNYQVENGGLSQWIYNGYLHDDAETFTKYLALGAATDSRCQVILERVDILNQYASDTECNHDGSFIDEEGESGFIGDMADCGKFDTWYYENCGKDDWWESVYSIANETQEHDLPPPSVDAPITEKMADSLLDKGEAIISVSIENAHADKRDVR
jgi:hypothetical protein